MDKSSLVLAESWNRMQQQIVGIQMSLFLNQESNYVV